MIKFFVDRIEKNTVKPMCTTNALGIRKLWPLLTVGRCSKVLEVIKFLLIELKKYSQTPVHNERPWDSKFVALIDSWSLFRGHGGFKDFCRLYFKNYSRTTV